MPRQNRRGRLRGPLHRTLLDPPCSIPGLRSGTGFTLERRNLRDPAVCSMLATCVSLFQTRSPALQTWLWRQRVRLLQHRLGRLFLPATRVLAAIALEHSLHHDAQRWIDDFAYECGGGLRRSLRSAAAQNLFSRTPVRVARRVSTAGRSDEAARGSHEAQAQSQSQPRPQAVRRIDAPVNGVTQQQRQSVDPKAVAG